MKHKIFKLFCLSVSAAVAAGCVSGCSGNGKVKDDNKLTYWVEFGNQPQSGVNNFAELPVYKEVLKRTGVDVEFKHPANGQVQEQFNLMLASQDLPDIIQYQIATDYPGGASKAIQDGCIVPLDIDKAPNLKAYLKDHPEVDKQIKTDDGQYYTFPCIYGDDSLQVYTGIIVRQDILDKIGCKMPETIDEWHTVLTKAKEAGIKSPLTMTYAQSTYFAQAYGICMDLYVDEDKVKFGENEDNFKDFVQTMRTWYSEGLIDSKLASMDATIIKQNVINGDTLAVVGNCGGGIGSWSATLAGTGAKLVAAPFPVLKKGDTPYSGHRINEYSPFGSACITTACKDLDAAYKLLDYGYSEEGHMLFNFGIEGESYVMKDGYPTYTDLITNNPDGKPMSDMVGIYCNPNGVAVTVKDARYMEQFASLPEQQEALKIWNNTNARDHIMPPITLTVDESGEAAGLKNEINSYIEQTILKYITGVESMDSYDTFRDNLKKLNIDKYLEIQQNAYDRYQNR